MSRLGISARFASLGVLAMLLAASSRAQQKRLDANQPAPPPPSASKPKPAPSAQGSAQGASQGQPAPAQPAPSAHQPAPAASQQPAPSAPQQPGPAPGAAAQRAPARADSARAASRSEVGRELKQLADSLHLSQAQRDKVRPILADHAYQLRQIRMKYAAIDRTPTNRAIMQQEVAMLREGTDAKLAQVLSPEQMSTYRSWRAQAMSRAKTRLGAADSTVGGKK